MAMDVCKRFWSGGWGQGEGLQAGNVTADAYQGFSIYAVGRE
jgi:hypothetical protein